TAAIHSAIELESLVGRCHGRRHTRTGQLEHPPDVGRKNEMPGRTQHVRAENLPSVELALDAAVGRITRALSNCPFRTRIVLGLHRAERLDDVARSSGTVGSQELPGKASPANVASVHVSPKQARSLCVLKPSTFHPTHQPQPLLTMT